MTEKMLHGDRHGRERIMPQKRPAAGRKTRRQYFPPYMGGTGTGRSRSKTVVTSNRSLK